MQYVGSVLSGLIFPIRCEKMQKDPIRCENSNVFFLMWIVIGELSHPFGSAHSSRGSITPLLMSPTLIYNSCLPFNPLMLFHCSLQLLPYEPMRWGSYMVYLSYRLRSRFTRCKIHYQNVLKQAHRERTRKDMESRDHIFRQK